MAEPKNEEFKEFARLKTDLLYRPDISRAQKEICKRLKISQVTHAKWNKKIHPKGETPKDDYDEYLAYIKELAFMPNSPTRYKELYAELMGWRRKASDKLEGEKVDFSPSDRIRAVTEIRNDLRREWEDTGHCSVCGFSKALCDQTRLDTESEREQDRQVATLGLPAGII